ncbi:helix-turn-helix domain-containing transcriptional regulator [Limnofasciculus baicalensis]|uniref:Transcriptional regulator n=1 Tax=Limnofasciculus baicalensis BBK-W-15 TaxID=2699891 RepID=A0AAE3GPG2_9CYAN|nr:transcriptional regulator [Limnofasciculus baicalensis]MCP2727508.1 transcriptional regulator [Limnofasciculus baicalensis BBK-W-15]
MAAKTRSYQEYLIESLKEPSEAALYLWAILQEENPESNLLPLALRDVAEALGEVNLSPEEAKLHLDKLDELMKKGGVETIYGLLNWLKTLGLILTVVVDEDAEDHLNKIPNASEVTV